MDIPLRHGQPHLMFGAVGDAACVAQHVVAGKGQAQNFCAAGDQVRQHVVILVQHPQRIAHAVKQLGGVQPVGRAGELVDPGRVEGIPESVHVQNGLFCKLFVCGQWVLCAVLCHRAAVAEHQLRAAPFRTCQQLFQQVGGNGVVAVHHREPLALGGIQPGVARTGRPRPGLSRVQGADAGVFFRPGIAHFRAMVGAGIVDEQQFKIRIALRQDAFHTGVQRFFGLVDRHQDTDGGH